MGQKVNPIGYRLGVNKLGKVNGILKIIIKNI